MSSLVSHCGHIAVMVIGQRDAYLDALLSTFERENIPAAHVATLDDSEAVPLDASRAILSVQGPADDWKSMRQFRKQLAAQLHTLEAVLSNPAHVLLLVHPASTDTGKTDKAVASTMRKAMASSAQEFGTSLTINALDLDAETAPQIVADRVAELFHCRDVLPVGEVVECCDIREQSILRALSAQYI